MTPEPRFGRMVAVVALAIASLCASSAAAGTFSRLQVLLPGETAAPGTTTGKTGAALAQAANVPFTITVRACDSQWNTVGSVTDVVQMLASDASATLPAPAQLEGGTRTFTVTLNAGGSFTVYAHDQSDVTISDGASAAVITQVIQGFRFSKVDPKDQKAGDPFAVTLTARDPAGNVVRGFNGTVNLKEITNFGDAATSPQTVTLSGGTWSGQVTVYRVDLTVDRGAVLYAWLTWAPQKDGSSNPFNVHAGRLARLQIVVPGQVPEPASASGLTGAPASQIAGRLFTVGVYSTDTWWNPVNSDHNVRITSSDPAANTPLTGKLNHSYKAFSVSLGTVGTQTLTVTDLSDSRITGMTTTGITVIPSGADHFVIEPVASPQVAGAPVAVTIRATDANGNTIPAFNSDAVLFANTGLGSISPEYINFTDGVWTGSMVFRGAGANVSFTCSDFATTPHTGTSNRFEVRSGPFAAMQILLPGETAEGGTAAGKSGAPIDQTAGTPFTITVRAVDQFQNLVNTVNDRVALGSTDLFAGVPAETTLTNGLALVPARLYRSGAQRIWVRDTERPAILPDTSSDVTVIGGAFSRVLVLAPGEFVAPGTESGRAGAATDQSINYAFTCTVLATDQWWNPVGGVSDVVRLVSDDPGATMPPDHPMVDGRAEMTVRLARGGYTQLTVTDVTQPSRTGSSTQVRAISSGFHLQARITQPTARAGEPFTLTVGVTNDAGSVIQEINSFVTLEVLNASTREPGRGTLLTTQFQLLQGQRAIAETYTFAEAIVLVARDDAGNAPATSDVITIMPGPPAAIHLTSNPSWVHGNKNAVISALLADEFENGVPDQPMSFALLQGSGTVTPVDDSTNASGVATADFLSPRQPETARIRATSGGISSELEIQTAFVDPDAPGGSVTNYPNPFHPPLEPTTIAYKLDDNANVMLRIFTLSGVLVRRETFGRGGPGGLLGLNEWQWDGRNGNGQVVASGGYVLLIEAQGPGETLHVIRRRIAAVR